MAWFSSIKKFSWSDVVWTTNRTRRNWIKSGVTSVWHGGAAESAKQHQKCNVRFFLLPTLPQFHFLQRFLDAFPEMISFLAASMWSWKSLIAADIVSSSVLASTIFFQKRSHFWQTSSRGVLICIWVNQISPWEIFRVRIYVIHHRTVGTSGELLFSCLMLKDILVESRHFMELRVV